MSGNPVFVDNIAPEKADARAYLVYRFGSADEVRNSDLTGTWFIFIDDLLGLFRRDTSDTTSADDNETVIVDDAGNRWKLVAFGGAVDSVNGQTGVVSLRASDIPYSDDSPSISVFDAIRDRLTANRTYYVRTDGSDSNNGLANTSGGAFASIHKAWNTILKLDLNGFSITVQIGDGTYTAGLSINSAPLGGNVTFQGNNSTPSNVLISTSGTCIQNNASGFQLLLRDLKVESSGSNGIVGTGGSFISVGNIDFGACSDTQLRAETGAVISVDGNYTISGSAGRHWAFTTDGKLNGNTKTITLSGTPAFSSFAALETGGILNFFAATFSGSATGARYSITSGGIINLYGAGTSALPGDSAGSGGTATGGGFYT